MRLRQKDNVKFSGQCIFSCNWPAVGREFSDRSLLWKIQSELARQGKATFVIGSFASPNPFEFTKNSRLPIRTKALVSNSFLNRNREDAR